MATADPAQPPKADDGQKSGRRDEGKGGRVEWGDTAPPRRRAPRRRRRAAPPAEGPPGEEPEEPLRGLYFVRIAKPSFDGLAVARLQQELEMHVASVKLLTETLRVKRMDKNQAHANTQIAQEALRASQQRVRAKRQEVQPLRAASRRSSAANRELRDSRQGLEYLTEEELDKRIAGLEYSIEHETVSHREEKDIVAQIKKLQAQRPRVREYAAKKASVNAQVPTPEDMAYLSQADRELKVLREEEDSCRNVQRELLKVEKRIDEEVREVLKERAEVTAAKDATFKQLRVAQGTGRGGRQGAWRNNRAFSKKVRAMVAEGKIEEAKEACEQQTEAMMAKLNSDTAYREEYLKAWETQRQAPRVVVGMPEADVEPREPKPRKKREPTSSILDVPLKPGQSKADAVIERALAAATAELAAEKAGCADPLLKPSGVSRECEPVVGDSATEPRKPPAPKKEAVNHLPMNNSMNSSAAPDVLPFELPAAAKEQVAQLINDKDVQKKIAQEGKGRKERSKTLAQKRRQKAIEGKQAREADAKKASEETKTQGTSVEPNADAEVSCSAIAASVPETEVVAVPKAVTAKEEPRARHSTPDVAVKTRSVGARQRMPRRSKGGIEAIASKYQWHAVAAVLALLILLAVCLMAM
ncbi:unnamed protein product [Ostreobium quekettii]|uniref:Proton pump-interactor 1 n=1 Tax=Ostreobium quekettii TaxID=121088 RepID=A0A8S1J119_9CHLO|nr:unnamed protein product [Ostreobium quekettii]|eukprot:evm.model.scf_264.4 EVM.evm.TU.scf_264.4   scf_264:65476-69640(-)